MSAEAPFFHQLIDVTSMLRLVRCQKCSVGYAVPISLWLQRSHDRGEIFCPSGHVNQLAPDDEAPEAMQLLNMMVAAELENTRMQLASALIRANAAAPAQEGPISKAELKRRSGILAAKSGRDQERNSVCRFCGKAKLPHALASHYRRQHAVEVAALPSRIFD